MIWKWTAERILVGSFLMAILTGTLLLEMPIMQQVDTSEKLGFVDALFTATSATCVTGLVVRDTGGDFSFWGQLVILILIQLGGLGIITFTNIMIVLRRGRLTVAQRLLQEESTGLLPNLPAKTILKRVFVFTFMFELVGAAVFAWRFHEAYGQNWNEAVWNGIFHSVSAFCNAGFALFSQSFVPMRGDLVITGTLMVLIVAGGIGFVVFADFGRLLRLRFLHHRVRLAFHSRVVLLSSMALLFVGCVVFVLTESSGEAMAGHGLGGRLLDGLFQSVTCRTAGFNTIDTGQMTNASLVLTMFLMVIGASPGSSGGGMKTTTFAVIVALIVSRVRSRKGVALLGRCASHEAVSKALTTVGGYALLIFFAVTLLQLTEIGGALGASARGAFMDLLFETVSAVGTVGLSTGVTGDLSIAGRMVIIFCMFAGRLGPVLVAVSLIGRKRQLGYHYAEEPLIIG